MQVIDLFNDLDFDPGKLLDHRYQIVACLGHGGMGRVYKAFHVMLDAPVALKELLTPAHATDEERQRAIRRFRHEARLLTALRHPSIPRVLDYFTDGQSFYLVMDYIAGQTLAQRLQTDEDQRCEPLPLDEALDYACQLCNVLIYLHSQEPAVVFGDLKPSNVILTPDGRAVMVDFGIARPSTGHNEPLPSTPGGRSSSFADLIGDNQPLGTAGYAAPEQYEPGWHADPRSDIFALGVLLHQMVTGHAPPPFPFGFHPARELNPSVPPALEELIERALRFRADERFQSGWEMYRALRLVAQEVAFQQFQTEEVTTSPGDETPQVIIQPVTRRSHTQVLHLRRALLTSAGAAGAMMALTLALLFFSLGSNAHMAQNMLSHPFAAAPAPANTPTPTPTPMPTQPPRVSPTPTLPPPPIIAPGTVPTPTPTNTPTPTPPPTATPSPTPTATPTPTPTPTETPTPEPPPTPTPPTP